MAAKNNNKEENNTRRDFVKNLTLASLGLTVPFSSYVYPSNLNNHKLQTTQEDNIKRGLRVASILSDETRDKRRDTLKRAVFFNTIGDVDIMPPTDLDIEIYKKEVQKIHNMDEVELTKNYIDFNKNIRNAITIGQIATPFMGPIGKAAAPFVSSLAYFAKDWLNRDISEANLDIIMHERLYKVFDKNPSIKSKINPKDLGLETEKSNAEILEELDPEILQAFEEAQKNNTEKIEAYINEKSNQIIENTAKVIKEVIKERNKGVEEAKRKELYDKREKEGKIYLTKFLANQFLDEKSARGVTTGIDVTMKIASLFAPPRAGAWAMTAGFVGGVSALQSAFGNGTNNQNTAVEQALKEIKFMLKETNKKLDVVLENQQKILNRLNVIVDKILDKENTNHIEIRRELVDIKDSVLANRDFDKSVSQDRAYNNFDRGIDVVDTNKQEINPNKNELQEKSLDAFYEHSLRLSNDTIFNGRIETWQPNRIRDELSNLNRLDLHIDKVSLFIENLTGKNYPIGSKNSHANNPLEWARGAIAFSQTLMIFPNLVYDNKVKLKNLKKTGNKIKSDIDTLLSSENIDTAFAYYRQTIEAVIDMAIEETKMQTNKKTKILHEGFDMLTYHTHHLLGGDNEVKEKKRTRKVGDFFEATSKEKNNIKLKINDDSESYFIKTNSNLFLNPGNHYAIGDIYTTKENNVVSIADRMGLLTLVPIKGGHNPIRLDLPTKDRERQNDINFPHYPSISSIGKNQSPYMVINQYNEGWERKSSYTIKKGKRVRCREWYYSNNTLYSRTKFEFSAYQIKFNYGNYKEETIGDTQGWTIAKLKDEKTDEEIEGVNFWSNHLHQRKLRGKSLEETHHVLAIVKEELIPFIDESKKYAKEYLRENLSKQNTSVANEYEATAFSLQALGALKYWNNGNSLTQATAIARDHGNLYALLQSKEDRIANERDSSKPIKISKLRKPTLQKVFSKVSLIEPSIEDNVTVTKYIKEKMMAIVDKNSAVFKKTIFKENTSDIKGIPEVEYALKMIRKVEKQYGI